jgi:twitching motility protein PilT
VLRLTVEDRFNWQGSGDKSTCQPMGRRSLSKGCLRHRFFDSKVAMSIELTKLLEVAIGQDASDIHLTVGRPPSFRLNGTIRSLNSAKLTTDDSAELMRQLTNERSQQELAERGTAEFSIGYEGKARFRVSVFRQQGHYAVALRRLPTEIVGMEQLGLPLHLQELLSRPRGLVLVTGPTGAGKTTTLASMVDHLNNTYSHHIVTIEDPIEFVHPHKKSVVNQREVGLDLPSYSEGIHRALRQDPDVILLGEMRDLETMSTAITAAETGHLVLSTTHTTGAARTIDRIIDTFSPQQQSMVRNQLAGNLVAVISQVLVPTADNKGRVAAFEIMLNSSAIGNLIRESKVFRIDSTIQTSGNQGMVLLDDWLFRLYKKKVISFEAMMNKCKDSAYLQRKVQEDG